MFRKACGEVVGYSVIDRQRRRQVASQRVTSGLYASVPYTLHRLEVAVSGEASEIGWTLPRDHAWEHRASVS
jgi:hypothetical protein